MFTDYFIDGVSVFSRRKHLQKPTTERTTTQRNALEKSQTQIYGHNPLEQRWRCNQFSTTAILMCLPASRCTLLDPLRTTHEHRELIVTPLPHNLASADVRKTYARAKDIREHEPT